MAEVDQKVPDGGAPVTGSSVVDQFSEVVGMYGWFGLGGAALLLVAFVLNAVFQMHIVAGLIGAVVLLMGINVFLISVGLFVYRFGN